MSKIKNFKCLFSNILADEYRLSDEEINEYWKNKEKEEAYDEKKNIAIAVGLGEAIGTVGFTLWDATAGRDCIIPITICSGIAILTVVTAVLKKNPYQYEENEIIDRDYKETKKEYRKELKDQKRK